MKNLITYVLETKKISSIDDYVNEGLRINKSTKKNINIHDDFAYQIISFLYADPDDIYNYKGEENGILTAINNYIEKNNPKHINIITTEDSLLNDGFEEDEIDNLLKSYTKDNDLTLIIDRVKCSNIIDNDPSGRELIWKDKYDFNRLYTFDNYLLFRGAHGRSYYLFELV